MGGGDTDELGNVSSDTREGDTGGGDEEGGEDGTSGCTIWSCGSRNRFDNIL